MEWFPKLSNGTVGRGARHGKPRSPRVPDNTVSSRADDFAGVRWTMDRASRGLRILTCACVVFSSADVGDISNRHSQSDWRAAPAVVAYKEFLARERYLWKGTAFAVDSQVRWVGGPGLTRAEEPPLLFLLDRATLALAPLSHFAEYHPYSETELMVSIMRARSWTAFSLSCSRRDII